MHIFSCTLQILCIHRIDKRFGMTTTLQKTVVLTCIVLNVNMLRPGLWHGVVLCLVFLRLSSGQIWILEMVNGRYGLISVYCHAGSSCWKYHM